MNISITQHYHRYEYEINFYYETMIDAISTGRRFNYFRWPFLEIDDLAIEKFLLSSHFLSSCELISSFLSTFILYFQISGQSSSSSIGILRYIEICAVDETGYLQKSRWQNILPSFVILFPPVTRTFSSNCLFVNGKTSKMREMFFRGVGNKLN